MSEFTDNTLKRLSHIAGMPILDYPYAAGVCADALAVIHCLEADLKRMTKERDEALTMIAGREELHAAGLGIDFDKVAVLTARGLATKLKAATDELERLRGEKPE